MCQRPMYLIYLAVSMDCLYIKETLIHPLCVHSFADPDEDPSGNGSVTSYKRGLSTCVFVPWEGVVSSPLNLAVKDMDFWMPG